MIDKFFDCLNVKNPLTGWHKRKAFQDPYIPPDDKRPEDERLKVTQYTLVYAYYNEEWDFSIVDTLKVC